MTRDIRRMLRKKSWTGREVGQAIVCTFLDDYQHRDRPRRNPLFTQEEIDRMVLGLKNEQERQAYARYVQLYHGLMEEFNRSQALVQQAQHGQQRIAGRLSAALQGESARAALQASPAAVTQAAYDTLAGTLASALPAQEESPAGVVWHALCWYLGDFPGPTPRKPARLKAALEALKTRPWAHQLPPFPASFAPEGGYFVLPGGARTDRDPPAQVLAAWRALPEVREVFPQPLGFTPTLPDLYRMITVWTQGGQAGGNRTMRHTSAKDETLAFDVRDLRPQSKADRPTNAASQPSPDTVTWVDTVFSDTGHSCWQVLVEDGRLRRHWRQPGALVGDAGRAVYGGLASHFGELLAALLEAVAAQPELPSMDQTPDRQQGNALFTYGALSKAGVLGYAQLLTPSPYAVARAYAAAHPACPADGLAVLCPGSGTEEPPPDREALYAPLYGADALLDDPEALAELYSAREHLLLPALRWLTAYNALLGAVAEAYQLPEVLLLEAELSGLLRQVQGLSETLLRMLLARRHADAQDLADDAQRLRVLFLPVRPDELPPRPERVREARARLEAPDAPGPGMLSALIHELAEPGEVDG